MLFQVKGTGWVRATEGCPPSGVLSDTTYLKCFPKLPRAAFPVRLCLAWPPLTKAFEMFAF